MEQPKGTQTNDTDAGRRISRLDYYSGIALLGGILLLGDWGLHHARAVPAAPAPPAVVSAREFDVVDAAGHVEARFRSRTAANPDTLEVYDEKNKTRLAILAHAGQGTAVNLYGADGENRMTIATLEDSDETSIVAFSKGGKQVMDVAVTKGQGLIQFNRSDGTATKVINSQ